METKIYMDTKESRERMESGRIYQPNDEDIMKEQMQCLEKLWYFNNTKPSEMDKRNEMLKDMFGDIGDNCYIEPPLHSNWGGKNTHMGNNVYANFNLTLVDDAHIYIGDGCMFAPNVVLATAGHPIDPDLRREQLQYNLDIHIGSNVWIGAGAVVLPGVTIGDNSVIGAGSVVTKDIPANVVAVGNPCRVLREIGEHDKKYYYRDKEIDL